MLSRPSEGIFCMCIALLTAGFLFLTFTSNDAPFRSYGSQRFTLFAIRGHDATFKPLVSLCFAF